MNKKLKRLNELILNHSKLSIILVYNIISVGVIAAFYPILPILMGYPPNTIYISQQLGTSYNMQYAAAIILTVIVGTIFLLYLLKDVEKWVQYSNSTETDLDKLRIIRNKCMNLPYLIYIFQLIFFSIPVIVVITLVALIIKAPITLLIKIFVLVFSLISLVAIISHIFSKRIFTGILLRTYRGEKNEGIRISLKTKIFLQIIPMFVVAVLFTGMLGYSRLMEEKGDLVYVICNNLLKENTRIKDAANAEEVFATFNSPAISNVKISYFIVYNGRFISSDGYKPSAFFNYFINHPVGDQLNRVYGDTNESQGVITEINGKMGNIKVGIRYDLASSRTIEHFFITVLALLLLFNLILYFVLRNFIIEILFVANSLNQYTEEGNIASGLQIPVTSNDEIGDLIITFNEISERQMEYDKLKNEFLANISHELRTPLNVILATIQLSDLYVKKGLTNDLEKNSKNNKIIRQNCLRLLRLVNNIIDISKIEAGFIQLQPQPMDIIAVIRTITLSVSEYAKTKGISLEFESDLNKKILSCDPDKIERIILNLLSNAIKFTNPKGHIFVTIREKEKNLLISVRDTGIGIPLDKQEIIFERFRQVEQSLKRNYDGSGIGLSLVKSFVEMHGGNITVESEYGIGSEFIIQLPIIQSAAEEDSDSENTQRVMDYQNVEKINVEFSDIYTDY